MSATPALQLHGISHFYGDHQVLDDVNLVVNHASITALVGPSGGGKTTLLRIVAGFERPSTGTVSINGKTAVAGNTWVPPHQRGVAIVPQEGALFPHLSVKENVAFGLPRRGSLAAQARVAEMLELVDLPHTGDLRPAELSGGMQQRVALARALATNPALILLDEPFSALDAGLRESLREQISTILRTAGATTIWVTHDQDEALSVADTVAVLIGGRIAQLSDPVSLYRTPASLEVAGFIGETVSVPGVVAADRTHVATRFGSTELLREQSSGSAHVVIRPEQFEIVGADSPGAAVGTVVYARYFGHDGTIGVQLSDGLIATVRLHARLLPAVGSSVGVVINGRVLAFAD